MGKAATQGSRRWPGSWHCSWAAAMKQRRGCARENPRRKPAGCCIVTHPRGRASLGLTHSFTRGAKTIGTYAGDAKGLHAMPRTKRSRTCTLKGLAPEGVRCARSERALLHGMGHPRAGSSQGARARRDHQALVTPLHHWKSQPFPEVPFTDAENEPEKALGRVKPLRWHLT
eukprot:4237903-Pyramimonas_sp.AAC.1